MATSSSPDQLDGAERQTNETGGPQGTVIDVFADVACPFTHVGLRRFSEARTRLSRPDVTLRVRSWPLELVNRAPLDPDFIADEIRQLKQGVAPDLFTGFSLQAFPHTSLPALALAATAYNLDLATGEAISLELRDLLFEQGVDVSRTDPLIDLAVRYGFDFDPSNHSAVLADHLEGIRRHVIGSPHFFTSTGSFFCPALEISRDETGHLHISADPEGFEVFLSSCFA